MESKQFVLCEKITAFLEELGYKRGEYCSIHEYVDPEGHVEFYSGDQKHRVEFKGNSPEAAFVDFVDNFNQVIKPAFIIQEVQPVTVKPPRVVIYVKGGMVQSCYSTAPCIDIIIYDEDNIEAGDEPPFDPDIMENAGTKGFILDEEEFIPVY